MTEPRNNRRDLGVYRRVYMRLWNDERFRNLTKPEPSAQFLWLYLLTGPGTVAAPGVIRATRGGLADELGWSLDDLTEAFRELEAAGMAMADWSSGVVFLPKAAFYNPPASVNSIKTWAKSLDQITECDLKRTIANQLYQSLSAYSEAFRDAFATSFPEGFRDPGAGTGAGVKPPTPFSTGSLHGSLPTDQSDPAPQGGAAGSSRSVGSAESDPSQVGSERVDVGMKSQVDRGSESTGAGDGFVLDGGTQAAPVEPPPEEVVIPAGGSRAPGCTLCGDKVPGVMFRQDPQGVVLAAHCWGCASLGSRNDYKLPVPRTSQRPEWKRFEFAFPDRKRLRKRDRDRFAAEAAARTHKAFEGQNKARQAAQNREAEQRAREESRCDHCGGAPGCLYAEIEPGQWAAGLCPTCGGSVLLSSPTKFMGPAITAAGNNGVWKRITNTPAAELDAAGREAWHKAAVDRARAMIRSGSPVEPKKPADHGQPEPGVPVPQAPEPSDDWADDDVSGEPPPI